MEIFEVVKVILDGAAEVPTPHPLEVLSTKIVSGEFVPVDVQHLSFMELDLLEDIMDHSRASQDRERFKTYSSRLRNVKPRPAEIAFI